MRNATNLNIGARYYIPRSLLQRERNFVEIQNHLYTYNYSQDYDDFNVYDNQEISRRRNNLNIPQSFPISSLEFLLSIPQRINPADKNDEDDNNKLSLNDFKKKKI